MSNSNSCTFTPISAFQSTNLNSKIDSFCRLADRLTRSLGAPVVTVELHQDQIFENISRAAEMFSKYAGYTKEYLIFDSRLYEHRKGIRLDKLFTLADNITDVQDKLQGRTNSPETSYYITNSDTVYQTISAIPNAWITALPTVSGLFAGTTDPDGKPINGIFNGQLLDSITYTNVVTSFQAHSILSAVPITLYFQQSYEQGITTGGNCIPDNNVKYFSNVYDYDCMSYRRVIDVIDFDEGSTSGINTLFTIEQTLAQQTYFSYAMGNYGFDLISWYVLKDWMKVREKMLATKQSTKFNERTQYLQMWPEPNPQNRFFGVISCYVEKPLRDIIKEQWVMLYALALCKMNLAQNRGKFQSIALFGGQMFNSGDLMAQGTAECKELMDQLLTGACAGMGDADPCLFFVS